jgi:CBS domain-containing protein
MNGEPLNKMLDLLELQRKTNKDYSYRLSKPFSQLVRVGIDVISCDPTTSGSAAFEILNKSGFSSLPVVENNKDLRGMVDMADFSAWVLERYLKGQGKADDVLDAELRKELKETPVEKFCNASGIDSCYPQRNDVQVRELFGVLSRSGVHRVPLVNSLADRFGMKHVEGFVTQSHALDFVANHFAFFGPQILNRKISTIDDLVTPKVTSIQQEKTVLEAFQTLHKEKISGMPIVDRNGELVGSICFRDFRFVIHGTFSSTKFSVPLSEFVKETADLASPELLGLKDKLSPAVTFHSSETLLDLVEKLQQHKTHRAYLTKAGEKKPIGVCSVSDILRHLVHTLPYPEALSEKGKRKRREKRDRESEKTEELCPMQGDETCLALGLQNLLKQEN